MGEQALAALFCELQALNETKPRAMSEELRSVLRVWCQRLARHLAKVVGRARVPLLAPFFFSTL